MYHCTPTELAAQTGAYLWEMYQDLLCASVEAEVNERRSKMKT